MTESLPRWEDLPPFAGTIDPSDRVLLIAMTGGAKSTLAATFLLETDSLVAIDGKDALILPRARVVQLPPYADKDEAARARFDRALAGALAWQTGEHVSRWRRMTGYRPAPASNRVVIRAAPEDVDSFAAHDAIFWAIYRTRSDTVVWVDEITSTGATPQRTPPGLSAIAARGRTRGIGLWVLTQAPFGMVPGIVRRNAQYMIFGPIEPQDATDVKRPGIELATRLPTKRGRFIVYRVGDREPYRLYLPIPSQLKHWRAP